MAIRQRIAELTTVGRWPIALLCDRPVDLEADEFFVGEPTLANHVIGVFGEGRCAGERNRVPSSTNSATGRRAKVLAPVRNCLGLPSAAAPMLCAPGARYVHFHRAYNGVIRAGYHGAIARQIPGDSVASGMRHLHASVNTFLAAGTLPPGLDRDVAAAIFVAVLGRLREYSTKRRPAEKDDSAAGFMLLVLSRALLGGHVHEPGGAAA